MTTNPLPHVRFKFQLYYHFKKEHLIFNILLTTKDNLSLSKVHGSEEWCCSSCFCLLKGITYFWLWRIIFLSDSPDGFWQCTSFILLVSVPLMSPFFFFFYHLFPSLPQFLEGHAFCWIFKEVPVSVYSSGAFVCRVSLWMSLTVRHVVVSAHEPRFVTLI